MSTYDDYRTIDITIDGVNDYPAQIIVSTGDTDGRRIRAKFLVDGTPVTDATGAAIYYGNDNVPADSVPMTEETDGVYTGVILTAAYAGKACATVTVGLKKGASIVMSRSIRLIIDHAFGDDAPDNIDGGQLEDAINRAETAADAAEDSATAAKTSETNAKNSANSAASSASAAQSAKNSASAAATAAKTSETNAKTSENNAKASATAAKTSETNAKNSENNAKTSETKAASSAKTAQTAAERAQEIADNFGVTASATASAPGGAASVNVTKKGTSYDLAFTIPRGAQGPKGDAGAQGPKFSELRQNLQLVALSETRGLLVYQGGVVSTNSSGVGNISLISPSYTITPRNTPSWYGPVIVNQNTVEKARFITSKGNIQITAKASSSIQIAPFTLMVNLS